MWKTHGRHNKLRKLRRNLIMVHVNGIVRSSRCHVVKLQGRMQDRFIRKKMKKKEKDHQIILLFIILFGQKKLYYFYATVSTLLRAKMISDKRAAKEEPNSAGTSHRGFFSCTSWPTYHYCTLFSSVRKLRRDVDILYMRTTRVAAV